MPYDPYKLGRGFGEGGDGHDYATGHGEGGPASARVIVGYGFWIFLFSDIILFSCFFATFAVLRTATAGGPSGADLFEPWRVAAETAFLLPSSFAFGMAAVATRARSHLWTQGGLFVTGLLGLGFLLLEAQEFATMIAGGNGPDRSAFLSSFFALVGLHGLHVTVGLLVARYDDGAGLLQRLPGEHSAQAALLQPLLAHPRHHLGCHFQST